MLPHPVNISVADKVEENSTGVSLSGDQKSNLQEVIDASSPSSSSSSEDESSQTGNPDDQSTQNIPHELVLYKPVDNGSGAIVPATESIECQPPHLPGNSVIPRVLSSVGAFTVQCANCFKWRLIPTEEKYEEIREHILEEPFVCENAREWRPDISCDDPADITQDGSRLWAIDKPNIAKPPPGWRRELRIRSEGSSKFADVYYVAPSGKKLRSMVEIQKYLLAHPEFSGVTMARFSFQIPRPLQQNYVRKRPARLTAAFDGNRSLEPVRVNPLSWAAPDADTQLQLGRLELPAPSLNRTFSDSAEQPPRKLGKKGTEMFSRATGMFDLQLGPFRGPGQS